MSTVELFTQTYVASNHQQLNVWNQSFTTQEALKNICIHYMRTYPFEKQVLMDSHDMARHSIDRNYCFYFLFRKCKREFTQSHTRNERFLSPCSREIFFSLLWMTSWDTTVKQSGEKKLNTLSVNYSPVTQIGGAMVRSESLFVN